MKIKISLIFSILISSFTYLYAEVEELIVTGTLLENTEQDSSPVDIITDEDYKNFNIFAFDIYGSSSISLSIIIGLFLFSIINESWNNS